MTALAYAAIDLIWASTCLAIRIAVGDMPPLPRMGVRCTAAGLLLLAWAAGRRETATAAERRHAALAGALMSGGVAALVIAASVAMVLKGAH